MRISRQGLELIAEFEGFSDHIYQCTSKKNTIGFGHVVLPGEKFKIPISRERAYKMLADDAKTAENAVNLNVKVKLTQPQFDAIVSFVYNIGAGAFKSSTFLKVLNKGDFEQAAKEMLRWCKSNGQISKGLLNRRKKESGLIKV